MLAVAKKEEEVAHLSPEEGVRWTKLLRDLIRDHHFFFYRLPATITAGAENFIESSLAATAEAGLSRREILSAWFGEIWDMPESLRCGCGTCKSRDRLKYCFCYLCLLLIEYRSAADGN